MVRLCDPPSVNNKLKFEKEALVSPCQKLRIQQTDLKNGNP